MSEANILASNINHINGVCPWMSNFDVSPTARRFELLVVYKQKLHIIQYQRIASEKDYQFLIIFIQSIKMRNHE